MYLIMITCFFTESRSLLFLFYFFIAHIQHVCLIDVCMYEPMARQDIYFLSHRESKCPGGILKTGIKWKPDSHSCFCFVLFFTGEVDAAGVS